MKLATTIARSLQAGMKADGTAPQWSVALGRGRRQSFIQPEDR